MYLSTLSGLLLGGGGKQTVRQNPPPVSFQSFQIVKNPDSPAKLRSNIFSSPISSQKINEEPTGSKTEQPVVKARKKRQSDLLERGSSSKIQVTLLHLDRARAEWPVLSPLVYSQPPAPLEKEGTDKPRISKKSRWGDWSPSTPASTRQAISIASRFTPPAKPHLLKTSDQIKPIQKTPLRKTAATSQISQLAKEIRGYTAKEHVTNEEGIIEIANKITAMDWKK